MTKPITSKKEASKAATTKRALVQLRVTGFGDSKFPSAANLETAVQNRAQALGYNEVGTVTIDSADGSYKKGEKAMYIAPNSEVRFLKNVPLNKKYIHTMYVYIFL